MHFTCGMTILLYYMEPYSKLLAVCEENPIDSLTKDQQCASLAVSFILARQNIHILFILCYLWTNGRPLIIHAIHIK